MPKCYYPDWEGGIVVGEHAFGKDGFCAVCGELRDGGQPITDDRKADCLLVDKGDLGWEAKLRAWRLQRCPLQTVYYLTLTPRDLGNKILKNFVCDIFWSPELFCDAVEDLVKRGAYPDGSDIFFSWDREGKDIAAFRIPDFQPEARQFWAQVVIPELTKDGVTFYIHYGDTKITKSRARPKEVACLAHWAFFTAEGELGADAC